MWISLTMSSCSKRHNYTMDILSLVIGLIIICIVLYLAF